MLFGRRQCVGGLPCDASQCQCWPTQQTISLSGYRSRSANWPHAIIIILFFAHPAGKKLKNFLPAVTRSARTESYIVGGCKISKSASKCKNNASTTSSIGIELSQIEAAPTSWFTGAPKCARVRISSSCWHNVIAVVGAVVVVVVFITTFAQASSELDRNWINTYTIVSAVLRMGQFFFFFFSFFFLLISCRQDFVLLRVATRDGAMMFVN